MIMHAQSFISSIPQEEAKHSAQQKGFQEQTQVKAPQKYPLAWKFTFVA